MFFFQNKNLKEKKKAASQREIDIKRENTSIELHTERFARRLEQIFGDGGESECRGRGGGDSASRGCSHVHHHLFVYIEAADHLEGERRGQTKERKPFYPIIGNLFDQDDNSQTNRCSSFQ